MNSIDNDSSTNKKREKIRPPPLSFAKDDKLDEIIINWPEASEPRPEALKFATFRSDNVSVVKQATSPPPPPPLPANPPHAIRKAADPLERTESQRKLLPLPIDYIDTLIRKRPDLQTTHFPFTSKSIDAMSRYDQTQRQYDELAKNFSMPVAVNNSSLEHMRPANCQRSMSRADPKSILQMPVPKRPSSFPVPITSNYAIDQQAAQQTDKPAITDSKIPFAEYSMNETSLSPPDGSKDKIEGEKETSLLLEYKKF